MATAGRHHVRDHPVHRAEPGRDCQPGIDADAHFGLRGAQALRFVQRLRHERFEIGLRQRRSGGGRCGGVLCHGRILAGC